MIVLLKKSDTFIIASKMILSSFFCTVKVYHISIVLSIAFQIFCKNNLLHLGNFKVDLSVLRHDYSFVALFDGAVKNIFRQDTFHR